MRRRLTSLGLLAFLGLGSVAFAQVTGVINDANGFPESDAEVVVKGTGKVAYTDEKGNFDIDAKVGDILVVNGKEFKVTSATLGVLKTGELVDLSEVVLTGYTTKKKENITTSVTTLSAKEFENIPVTSFDQLLAGKAPGVEVNIGSGQPGSPASVVIRGAGSINGGTTPLYVVDGVQVNAGVFASLNPNTFENISILKDAAAKSIYGSQAGNGVIIVKTKSGRKNTGLRINYSSNVGVSLKPQAKFDMMSTQEVLNTQKALGWWDLNDPKDAKEFNELSKINTDWQNVFLREGITYQNDINFSGGSENTDFFIGLGHLDQKGIIENTGLQRFTGTVNVNTGDGKKFRIGINSNFGFSKKDNIVGEAAVALNNPMAAAYLSMPYDAVYNSEGKIDSGAGKLGGNAYETLLTQERLTQEIKAVIGVYGEYDFTKELTLRVFGAIDHTGRYYKGFIDPKSFGGSTTAPGNSGSLTRQYFQYDGINTNAMLKFDKEFGGHKVNAFVATEYVGKYVDGFNLTAYGLSKYLGNTVSSAQVTGTLLPNIAIAAANANRAVHIISYFGNVDYNYEDKYLVSANVRRDGGSLFSSDYKWGTFGGVSAAWVLTKENFLIGNSVLSDLKIRGSWGKLGNTGDLFGSELYNSSRYLSSSQYDGNSAFVPSSPLNTEFRWEVEEQYDFGLDFGFFNNRLTGTVDYYNRKTSDLYIDKSLSLTSGFEALVNYNGGEMVNKGVEISLNGALIRNKDVSLNLFANFAYNKNEITDLGEVTSYALGTSLVEVGKPFGSHYAVKWGGVDPTNGAPIYIGRDGQRLSAFDGAEAQSTFGSSYAPYSGGFGFNFNYKGFFAEAAFQFKLDFYRFNNMRFFNENINNIGSYNQYKSVADFWQTPGQVTDHQAYGTKMEFTSKFIEDSSFLRLRNARIGYSFSPDFLKNSGLKGATIYTNATNLFTWTKWTGLDPDDSNNLSSYEYPSPRIVTMGVNLTF